LLLGVDHRLAAAEPVQEVLTDRRLIPLAFDGSVKQTALGIDDPHRFDAGATVDERLHESFDFLLAGRREASGASRPLRAPALKHVTKKVPKGTWIALAGLALNDDRTLAQTVGEGDLNLPRHQQRGLQRRFGGQALGDQPYPGAE